METANVNSSASELKEDDIVPPSDGVQHSSTDISPGERVGTVAGSDVDPSKNDTDDPNMNDTNFDTADPNNHDTNDDTMDINDLITSDTGCDDVDTSDHNTADTPDPNMNGDSTTGTDIDTSKQGDSNKEVGVVAGEHNDSDKEGGVVTGEHKDDSNKEEGVVKPETSTSIYLSDTEEKECKPVTEPKVPRRMTRAQKAAMEALASFGGSDFSSIPLKKIDLKSKLKRQADQMRKEEEGERGDDEPPAKKPRTRLQRAREESDATFQHTALGEGVKKYSKVTMAKMAARKAPREAPRKEAGPKYQSRVERSKNAAIDSFGGACLDELPVKKTVKLQSAHVKARKYVLTATDKLPRSKKSKSPSLPPPAQPQHRLTLAEKARQEAIMSFGGNTLDNVMEGSKKKVARTLTASRPGKKAKKKKSGVEQLASGNGSCDRKEEEPLSGNGSCDRKEEPFSGSGSCDRKEKENLDAMEHHSVTA